jgi:hypothetical protein
LQRGNPDCGDSKPDDTRLAPQSKPSRQLLCTALV